jgi:hypothetical protein
MDLLIDAGAHARVQETVFFAVKNLLNLDVDVLVRLVNSARAVDVRRCPPAVADSS